MAGFSEATKARFFLYLRRYCQRATFWQGPCGALPRGTVRRTLTIPLQPAAAQGLSWALLLGELVAATLLVASGRLPVILLRSLQVFLRF